MSNCPYIRKDDYQYRPRSLNHDVITIHQRAMCVAHGNIAFG